MTRARLLAPLFIAASLTMVADAKAATLAVGPGRLYTSVAAAAAAASTGDTISLAAGVYHECATLRADNLTIRGEDPGATLQGVACSGKAALVIDGANVTVDNLVFTDIAVPDHNGAGIRMEGHNLTVSRSRFLNSEEGILTIDDPTGTLAIRNSLFMNDGNCIAACAHGVYAGHLKLVSIVGSSFYAMQQGHHIKSRAYNTTITNSTITDGMTGTSSYLVDLPNGGNLTITSTVLEKGPNSGNHATAISIGEEGNLLPTSSLVIKDSVFVNDLSVASSFVHNYTTVPAVLATNWMTGLVTPVSGLGTVR